MILKSDFKCQYPSGPVAGPVRDFLPRTCVEFVYVFLYGIRSAALRAAQGHRLSTDLEFKSSAAFLAFHIYAYMLSGLMDFSINEG
jgi:hypothetical protein